MVHILPALRETPSLLTGVVAPLLSLAGAAPAPGQAAEAFEFEHAFLRAWANGGTPAQVRTQADTDMDMYGHGCRQLARGGLPTRDIHLAARARRGGSRRPAGAGKGFGG